MKKKIRKARLTVTIDEGLHKKMQYYNKQIGINWSQVIEQSVMPLILLFDKVFKEIEESGESDITKIRMMFQKLIFEITGKAYAAYSAIENDLDTVEAGKVKTKK